LTTVTNKENTAKWVHGKKKGRFFFPLYFLHEQSCLLDYQEEKKKVDE